MPKLKNIDWKPVKLDSSVFTGDFDGLIGIEECVDYDLNEPPKKKTKLAKDNTKPKKNVKKKKANNLGGGSKEVVKNVVNETLEETALSPSKPSRSTEECTVDAWNSFGIPESVLQGIRELKFTQPTDIQLLTLPAAILGRRDILGAAETGSGKTLAFGLPILTGILKLKENSSKETNSEDESELSETDDETLEETGFVRSEKLAEPTISKPLYALILTPTRELAMQIKNNLAAFTKHTGVNVAVVVGGMAAVKQERILSKGPEIVIATPGRLWELIQLGNQHLSQVDNIRFLAIDETDRMLERGHFQELHNLLERINLDEAKRKLRQNFVFSATLTLVHDLPKHLVNKNRMRTKKIGEMTPTQKLTKIIDLLGITDPKIVDLSQGTGISSTLSESRISCSFQEKDYYVYYFLQKHPGRTLIFCNSIGCVKRLNTLLTLLNCKPLALHACMQQRQRLKNLEKFRDNENSIMIATDVAARGLDIPCIEHVLHYQTPRTSEGYVHRSGRTARASKKGMTVLLIEPTELKNYLKICKTLGKGESIPAFPVEAKFLNAVKERVHLARDVDKMDLTIKKANAEAGWFKKAADDMDIIVDDMAKKFDADEANSGKKYANLKRKQLQNLLNQPIFM